jgi:hypothetical protein
MDIIVSSTQSLCFYIDADTGKTFSCIDGCLGVVTAKSDLTKKNLVDALENLASLPAKSDITGNTNPLFKIRNYDDWPYKVIFAPKGANVLLILSELNAFYESHPEVPKTSMPNAVYVVSQYLIQNTGYKKQELRNGTKLPPYSFAPITETSLVDKIALPYIIVDLQERAVASNHIVYILSIGMVNSLIN